MHFALYSFMILTYDLKHVFFRYILDYFVADQRKQMLLQMYVILNFY